jgi:hypothetical protein
MNITKTEQAGAELCQAQFMVGLALQDLQAFPRKSIFT